jgi:predicted hydrocarbon binding protein
LVKTRARVPTYFYSPKKKLVHVVVKLMDTPGSLGAVLSLLGGRVNLLGVTTYSLDDGTAILSAFAETISPTETPQKLSKLIATAPVVLEHRVTESSEGFLVDTFHTGIESGKGMPAMLFFQDSISHMFDGLVKLFGSGGEVLLYNEGFFVGEAKAANIMGVLGPGLARRKVSDLMYLLSAQGWGRATWAGDAESERPTVRLEDCFECSSGEVVKKGCSFMRGYLDGWGKALLERDVRSTETRCRLNGDDACEFALDAPPK